MTTTAGHSLETLSYFESFYKASELKMNASKTPEALKGLYRSPAYKKNQLVLCKNYDNK
jgi:hypothetical protein